MGRTKGSTNKPKREVSAYDVRQVLGPIGASGTTYYTGFQNVHDPLEYVSELEGDRAIDTYNRMRRSDGQVKLALLALENPIVNAEWKLHPPGDPKHDDHPTPQELEQTKRLNQWIFGQSFAFTDTVRQILSMFWAGFSVFEKIYKMEDDNFLCIKRLAPRLQNTIREWDVDDEGRINRIRQVIYTGQTSRDVWIPGNKCVVFSFQKEGDDYRGISALRAAYKHWFHKDFFYRIDAMRIEKWSLGIPVIKEVGNVTTNSRKASLIEAAENMRAHERGYVYCPKGYEIELLDSGAGKMVDPIPSIQHHDQQILKTIMAQFFEFGMTQTGARSVGETIQNQYLNSLKHVAKYVAQMLTKHVIEPVARMNYGDDVRAPRLEASGIQADDMQMIAGAFNSLGNSNLVTKGPKIEAHIREVLGIPQEDEDFLEQKRNQMLTPPPAANASDSKPNPDSDDDGGAEDSAGDDTKDGDKQVADDNNLELKAGKKKSCGCGSVSTKRQQNVAGTMAPPLTPIREEPVTVIEFWRPLRPNEEFMSLKAIAAQLDDSREAVVRNTRKARDKVIEELMAQMDDVVKSGDIKGVKSIDYSDEIGEALEAEVINVLWDIYEFGFGQVHRELKLQTKKVKNAFPGFSSLSEKAKLAADLIASHAFTTREISLDKLVDLSRSLAITAIRTGIFVASEIREQLSSFSENRVRNDAGFVVNDAHALGRDRAIQERRDDIAYVEYSAILDQGTCGPCKEVDERQQKYQIGSAEFEEVSPPLQTCEGLGRCRCIWVVVHKDETTPEV